MLSSWKEFSIPNIKYCIILESFVVYKDKYKKQNLTVESTTPQNHLKSNTEQKVHTTKCAG